MTDKLKACPFCGEEDCLQFDQHGDVYVSCLDKSNGNNWNTRPIEDALNARIAELEAEVTNGHELQDAYCDRIAELENQLELCNEQNERLK
jgi:hypothetical protein